MKAYLLLLCFTGVLPASRSIPLLVSHRYYLIKTKLTWPEAQNYCRETFSDLATVESVLDWLRLNKELTKEGLTDVAWVGLYQDVNTWRWSFNDVPFKNTSQQWHYGQPDNFRGHEPCCLTGPYGKWWDYPCEQTFPFICYNANNTYLSRYVGITSKLSWKEAQAYCREFHTDLAFATTSIDNAAMQKIAFSQSTSWIGGYRDTWKWSDGTVASNLFWLSGQPDNYYQDENCALLENGMFMDTKCTGRHYFICHIPHLIRRKQMLRLQFKSDLSTFDSDVQSAILELIKGTLNENGMLENTTVSWRVPSDRQIFRRKKTDL